jgi:hypothetical protein
VDGGVIFLKICFEETGNPLDPLFQRWAKKFPKISKFSRLPILGTKIDDPRQKAQTKNVDGLNVQKRMEMNYIALLLPKIANFSQFWNGKIFVLSVGILLVAVQNGTQNWPSQLIPTFGQFPVPMDQWNSRTNLV